jgi:branched-chain amino acid transport system ATP-binding protein
MTDATPALLVAELMVMIGAQIVLRQVHLEVPDGAIVCVLGSNGAGKTTLVQTVRSVRVFWRLTWLRVDDGQAQ